MLIPQLKLLIDVAGDVIWIQDDTGVYDANNIGGWGDPNQERNEMALMIHAKRTDDVDVVSTLLSDQIVWNAGLANTDVSEFQITLDQDGIYNIYLFVFPVTTDGIDDLEGTTIVSGDIVFYNGLLQTFNGSIFTEVDPSFYDQFIDDVNIPQVFCEDIIMPNIIIKYNELYKTYRQKRLENCEDISDDREQLFDLRMSIEGTEYAFRSNLKTQARTNLEALHNEYD